MENSTQWIGIGAGVCTGVSMLPQLCKIIKEKKAESLSWFMLIILLVGVGGWIWYGIRKSDAPIIATNGFSLIMNILITVFSLKYKQQKKSIIQPGN